MPVRGDDAMGMPGPAMRRIRGLSLGAALAVFVAGCGGGQSRDDRAAADSATMPPPPPGLAVCGGTTITDSGVGELRIGQAVAEVSARCTVVRDTIAIRDEGQSARVIAVDFGADTVEAEVVRDSVWRIDITSPAFRTADSLGVGTAVPALLERPGLRPLSGEGRVFVTTDAHCGLSFQLSVADTGRAAGRWTVEDLRRLPSGTQVVRVLVIGCGSGLRTT